MPDGQATQSTRLKTGLAEMLKGGVIMDVTTAAQARIAERAGAVAVMALERVPAQIRAEGGVARMASPIVIRDIMHAVSIPVMAKCRIGHSAEAHVLQQLGVDYIDESEVLTPADEAHHVDKHAFTVPFVCGARGLGEALRRIAEGAAMIRTKGEAGTGDVAHAVAHLRRIVAEIRLVTIMSPQELYAKAKELEAPYELVRLVAQEKRLPVPNFCAGGIATPADAALVMQLGAEAVFVGSGIFMASATEAASDEDAERRARAIVEATTHYNDPPKLLEACERAPGAMKGIAVSTIGAAELLQTRGWLFPILTNVLAEEVEHDAPPVASCIGPKPPLAFACAGCMAAGRVSYDLARELDRQGEVEMSCLAGIGARHPRFLRLLPGRRVLVIDGCRTGCARGIFNQAGLANRVRWHICLPDFGVGTQQEIDGETVDVGALAERVIWSLYEG